MNETDDLRFRRIRVSGSPYDRGFSYGQQAASEAHASKAGYELAVGRQLRWSWAVVMDASVSAGT